MQQQRQLALILLKPIFNIQGSIFNIQSENPQYEEVKLRLRTFIRKQVERNREFRHYVLIFLFGVSPLFAFDANKITGFI